MRPLFPNRRRLLQALALAPLGLRTEARAEVRAEVRTGTEDDGWQALRRGGVAVLLRHAITEPGVGDPPGFRIDDCATQRNLSDLGRAQARRIGAEFATRSIAIDDVLSSRWCRCLETARLAFPAHPVRPFEALNSFFEERGSGPRQTAEVQRYLAGLANRNVVLVTHMVNIQLLSGVSVGAGEALIVRADTAGRLQVVGRIAAA